MRKIIPPPTAFASFTGSVEYVGNSDADLSRNLAENVDLPAIFRTLDQGVCPGLIMSGAAGETFICSGDMVVISGDVIAITFAPIRLFGIFVMVGLNHFNPGGAAAQIPGTDWWLDASSQNLE
jgi:hypothetical protein